MITPESNAFDFKSVCEYISQIKARFPFAEVSVIGKTICKREIMSLTVGSGEQTVLLLGGMDGTDRISPYLLLRFFERLCISLKNDLKISAVKTSNILREQKICVVPVVNPDGMEISFFGAESARICKGFVQNALGSESYSVWKSNARGVEPYLNFNFDFPQIKQRNKPAPYGNYGPSAESETETKAVADFIRKNCIKHSLLLSANGNKIIYSDRNNNSDNALMAQIFKSISGFSAERRNPDLCPGNFCEWFQRETKHPSFEFSFDNPKELTAEYFTCVYQNAEELLMLSSII